MIADYIISFTRVCNALFETATAKDVWLLVWWEDDSDGESSWLFAHLDTFQASRQMTLSTM